MFLRSISFREMIEALKAMVCPAKDRNGAPPPYTRHRVAICIGHSRPGDQGAVSAGGITEWDFNQAIGRKLVELLDAERIVGVLIDTYHGASYGAAMRWLGGEVRHVAADAAIELHFNAAGPTAHGFEYLHWAGSAAGERLANAFRASHRETYPAARDRGIKALGRGARGAEFLRLTPCPAIIAEPFFGSNQTEWAAYSSDSDLLAEVYCKALTRYFA
jgi:N-acetylmuramoyl-L-alanine amidase